MRALDLWNLKVHAIFKLTATDLTKHAVVTVNTNIYKFVYCPSFIVKVATRQFAGIV